MHSDSVISRLIRLIHFAQEAENDYLGILSVGERAAQGTYQEWAPKDMVAHTNYWRKRAIEMLAYLSREQQPPEYPSDEQVNRENFEENHDVPLEQLMRESRSILKAMEEALRRFEDGREEASAGPYRGTPLSIAFPPDRSEIEAEASDGEPLVVQAEGTSSNVQVFGPLMNEPLAGRINADVARWSGGDSSCASAA